MLLSNKKSLLISPIADSRADLLYRVKVTHKFPHSGGAMTMQL